MARQSAVLCVLAFLSLTALAGCTSKDTLGNVPGTGDTPQTKTIDVHAHYTEPAGSMDGAECRGLATFTPECRIRNVGNSTFTGTMWGDEHYDLTGADPSALPNGKITYEGAGYIDGGVVGCGNGTYIFEGTDGYIDMTKYDPITDSAPGYNTWHLRTGSGTGELTNLVSGEGETHWTFHPSGTTGVTPKEGEGDFTGTITCRSALTTASGAGGGNTANDSAALHNVTINVDITSPGGEGRFAGYDQPQCGVQTGVCELYIHQTDDFVDQKTFNGTMADSSHAHLDTDGNLRGAGTLVFTGSIAGCAGAGTVTWTFDLYVASTPVVRTDGYVLYGRANVTAQTGYTGFAGVADPRPAGATTPFLTVEAFLNPQGPGMGTMTGTIACK